MKRDAFSLVELLVVIAIILLLTAMLVPTLQRTKEEAKTVVCSSNVRQLLLALIAYETQNHTYPYACEVNPSKGPPPGGYLGNIAYDKQGWWWFDFVSDFLGKNRSKETVLLCPARNIRESSTKPNILLGNYGVNEAICKNSTSGTQKTEIAGVPLRTSQIPHQGQTLLVIDSGYSIITWWHAADTNQLPSSVTSKWDDKRKDSGYVPGLYRVNKNRLPLFRLGVDFSIDALYGRHPNKGVNAGFVDGHVAQQKADSFYVEKIGSDYKNRSPLWLPTP